MDAFPNAILWPLFPAAPKMTDYRLLYGSHWPRTWIWSDGTLDYHLYAQPPGLPALPIGTPRRDARRLKR